MRVGVLTVVLGVEPLEDERLLGDTIRPRGQFDVDAVSAVPGPEGGPPTASP